jgi:hypothetical protein
LQPGAYVHFYSEQTHSAYNFSDSEAHLFITRFYQYKSESHDTRQASRRRLWKAQFGSTLSDQTVANILRRHRIAPAPQRSQTTSWKDFIAAHMNVLVDTDFFKVEVFTWRGLVTHYVLFFLHLETRRVSVAGITRHPDREWMEQIARSATSYYRVDFNISFDAAQPANKAPSEVEVATASRPRIEVCIRPTK